ncbi:hypothetical protein JW960_28440 [candidate division KSB1 bacterium]|nr:hypothetical protein [candidate division KSB1 bacterium]
MGQQQLLLLVLGTVIVGVAIVVGINVFSSGAIQANQDAVIQDCLTIAGKALTWAKTPQLMGGGMINGVASFGDGTTDCDFYQLKYASTVGATTITNANGSFTINTAAGNDFQIEGTGVEGGTVTINVDLTNAAGQEIEPPTIVNPS